MLCALNISRLHLIELAPSAVTRLASWAARSARFPISKPLESWLSRRQAPVDDHLLSVSSIKLRGHATRPCRIAHFPSTSRLAWRLPGLLCATFPEFFSASKQLPLAPDQSRLAPRTRLSVRGLTTMLQFTHVTHRGLRLRALTA